MNKTSADKIRSATPFLIWFRRHLPQALQGEVQPYLDRPYQLALKILDHCESTQPMTVKEIAQAANVAQDTARQVLLALKEGGMPFAVSPTRGWQSVHSVHDSEGAGAELLSPDSFARCSTDPNVLNALLLEGSNTPLLKSISCMTHPMDAYDSPSSYSAAD